MASSQLASNDVEDVFEPPQEPNVQETGRRVEKDSYSTSGIEFKQPTHYPSSYPVNFREESGIPSISMDKGRPDTSNSFGGSTSQRIHSSSYSQDSSDQEEKVKKVSPPRRKVSREEKPERTQNWSKRDLVSASDVPATTNSRQHNIASSQNTSDTASRQYETTASRQYETTEPSLDENIDALLEVKSHLTLLLLSHATSVREFYEFQSRIVLQTCTMVIILFNLWQEEEALITAHRKEIEDTMEIVREVVKVIYLLVIGL